MASMELDARMRFLDQASEAFSVTAPAVSSYLQTTKRDAASVNGVETATMENTCSACGSILLLGWSCEPLRSANHKQTRQQRISGKTTSMKVVKCSSCGAETTIRHQKRLRTTISQPPELAQEVKPISAVPKKKSRVPEQQPEATTILPPSPPAKEQTTETNQPKPSARRKARGKNASLQALLANKKQEAPKSSGFGLDFMDFMK